MSDFLDYAEDLINDNTDVTPDELAPKLGSQMACGSTYDEVKDPEIKESFDDTRLRLFEASMSQSIEDYIVSDPNPTYKGYMKSPFANSKVTPEKFKKDLVYFTNRGVAFGSSVRISSTGGEGYKDTAGAVNRDKDQEKKRKPGPYEEDRDENYTEGEYASQASAMSSKYATQSLLPTADEIFQDVFNVVRNIVSGDSDIRHAIIYGDPGIGKTYEVTETCKRYMPKSRFNYVYERGATGSVFTSLVPFLYKHSQDYVIVLDDNDKMIMKGGDQEIMTFMKGILDPEAHKVPVSVKSHMLRKFQQGYEGLQAEEQEEEDRKIAAKRKKKEGVEIEINTEALREGRLVINVDNEPIIDKYITLSEAEEWNSKIIPLREVEPPKRKDSRFYRNNYLREAEKESLADYLNDLVGDEDQQRKKKKDDDDDMQFIENEDGEKFPRKFTFNSSVIFVSNLSMNQIDTALIDRASGVEVKLKLPQFLERLGKIYGGLAKIREGSSVDPKIREWSKKCVYTVIGILIELWQSRKPMFGGPIEINRKMTFRMFNDFVMAWEMYAKDMCERVYGEELSMSNKGLIDKLSKDLVDVVIKRKCIPWLKTPVKD